MTKSRRKLLTMPSVRKSTGSLTIFQASRNGEKKRSFGRSRQISKSWIKNFTKINRKGSSKKLKRTSKSWTKSAKPGIRYISFTCKPTITKLTKMQKENLIICLRKALWSRWETHSSQIWYTRLKAMANHPSQTGVRCKSTDLLNSS